MVSLRKKADHVKEWQITTTFNVSQKERHILAYYKRYMRCGRLQERPDGVVYFVVENRRALWENVIPFFTQFPFLSMRKQNNFRIFKEVVRLLAKGEEKNPDGFMKIVRLREQLNKGRGRKRKYELRDFQDENPQRLYAELVPTLNTESGESEKIKSGLMGDHEPRNQSGYRETRNNTHKSS